MTHAESGTLLSYIDGQLDGSQAEAVEVHLAGCASCREDLDSVRSLARRVSGALSLISPEAPMAEARTRLEKTADSGRGAGAVHVWRSWRFASAGLLKAAAIVLLLAGVASAAIPGSPVRRLAAALLEKVTGPDPVPGRVGPPAVAAPEAAQEPAGPTSGVVLPVESGQVRVSIHSADPSARVVVRLVDGEGSIHATTDSEVLRFRTGPGYVDVSDVRLGVVIEIPRSLRAATVEVDGRVFWRKDGDGTRALQPSTEETGGGIVFRGRS